MKKSGITVDFLINKMQEAAGIEDKEYFQQEFKKVLSENIDCLETAALEAEKDDDAESAIEIRNDVERFRRELERQAEIIICMWQVHCKVQNDGLIRI